MLCVVRQKCDAALLLVLKCGTSRPFHPGLVLDRRTGIPTRPFVEEVERILGYEAGDTFPPELRELPKWQSDRIRLAVLGNVIDVRALTHIFSRLPAQTTLV